MWEPIRSGPSYLEWKYDPAGSARPPSLASQITDCRSRSAMSPVRLLPHVRAAAEAIARSTRPNGWRDAEAGT